MRVNSSDGRGVRALRKKAAACFAAVAAASLMATASGAAAKVDLSGLWEIDDRDAAQTPAKLTPQAPAHMEQMRKERFAKTGSAVTPEGRWCLKLGTPFIMFSSPPLDFIQGETALGIIAEQQSQGRHIYLDGRDFPDPETVDTTSNGFSIGHWEGDTLVVETRYFAADKGSPFIPGGGYKSETGVMVERMDLENDAQRLVIRTTWTNPNVYAEPHSYTFTYHRMPPDAYSFESWCDASEDPFRAAYDGAGPDDEHQ